MYPASLEYQEKIKKISRTFKAEIEIQHSTGVLNLSDKELAIGTLTYTESSQSGEEFTIGSTVASNISFTILNKPEYDNISFEGATIIPTIFLLIGENPDRWEGVPLGKFNIDEPLKQRNTIQLKAIDNMIKLDMPYLLSNLSFPANLYQIYVNICNVADIQVGTVNFPNMNYMVQERPMDDLTLRDMLAYVAELSGTFAKCNRNGALELKWYTPTGLELRPTNRFDFKAKDYTVQIKGIMATIGNTIYLAGSEDYAIDLTDNPLLQGDYETVLPNIFNNIKDTVFTPFESKWQGDPALQAGDLVTQVDRDGNIFNTLVTSSTYKYRGASNLSAKGLPEIAKGYKGSTNKRIANIVRKQIKPIGDQLTTLEQAQLEATELLANMLGGYIIKDDENGILYIVDNPDIDLAMKVWKYGINGFGYSSNGKDGPFTTAVTADGSIVAMLVAANIITADMVQTGLLQSEDGSTWINLDDGTFSLKNKVKFINDEFSIDLNSEDLSGLVGNLEVGSVNLVSNLSHNWESGGLSINGQPIIKNNYMRTIDYYPHDSGNMIVSFLKDYGYEVTIYLYDRNFVNYDKLTISSEDAKGAFRDLSIGFFKVEVNKVGKTWGELLSWNWEQIKEKKWGFFTKKVSIESLRLKIENGDIPTAWTPSPHDTEENLTIRINEAKAEIKVTTDGITSRVERVETDTSTLDTRVSSAEQKITPEAITNTVESNTTTLASKSEVRQTADDVVLSFQELQNMHGEDVTIQSGNITLSKNGIKVEHSDYPGQYSEMGANGFFRQYQYGRGAYLNDIHVINRLKAKHYRGRLSPVYITLPERFRGRQFEVKVIPTETYVPGVDGIDEYLSGSPMHGNSIFPEFGVRITTKVTNINRNSSPPEVTVMAGVEYEWFDWGRDRTYEECMPISFDLLIIGRD